MTSWRSREGLVHQAKLKGAALEQLCLWQLQTLWANIIIIQYLQGIMCNDVLGVLTACLLAVREIELGASCEIRSFVAHA